MLLCSFCFVLPDVQVMCTNVPSCFPWDSSYHLKYGCGISACIASLLCLGRGRGLIFIYISLIFKNNFNI
jgi:hypothetical protein